MKVCINGAEFDLQSALTVYDAAKEAGLISRAVIAAKVNGTVCALNREISENDVTELLTFAQEEGKKVFRHTAAHILAQAVKRLFPATKLTIGPAVENGFYYDFDSETPFTPEVLKQLEDEMKKIVKENLLIERFELPRDEAVKLMEERGEPYKVQLINELPENSVISFYRQGEFVDLCAGPHLFSTGAVKAVKLMQCTGAYWKGDQSNKQLQRVYGCAFPSKEELKDYLTQMEEARKRDHNKIGRELEFFTTVDVIGQGLPVLLPKGARVVQLMQRWIEDEEQKRGYLLTKTPLMAKRDLYKISGHWDHYRDGMFIMGNPDDETEESFALRPMTCPFQYQVFLNKRRSYRDLPMRLAETSTLFRNEDSGEMHGLIRVRQFTISEGHLIIRPDQLEEEFRNCVDLAKYCLETLGIWEDCTFRFSQWDPKRTDKYEGSAEQWNEAQEVMGRMLDNLGIEYEIGIDEAAFYGPKLDIQCKNVFGKEDTIVTVQIDMLLAKKFNMEYVDSENKLVSPYIIHRTSMGCYERTLALLLEKYAGALPLWLSPTQATVIPVNAEMNGYASELAEKMQSAGIRAKCDDRNETMGKRIREAQLEKIPYMLIVGAKEQEEKTVSVRTRKGEDLGAMPVNDMLIKLITEINNKVK